MSRRDHSTKKPGYRNPPREHQFRAGQSGNPAGRPKKQGNTDQPQSASGLTELDASLGTMYKRKVPMTVNGKRTRQPLINAVTRAQVQTALKGNATAQRDILNTARDIELQERALTQEEARELATYWINMRALKRERKRIWDEAAKRGEEPEQPWPHPDDILVDLSQKRPRLRGPIDETDLAYFEYIRAQRDLMLAMAEWSLRGDRRSEIGSQIYRVASHKWDEKLPLRWQLGATLEEAVHGAVSRLMRLRELSLPQLNQHIAALQAESDRYPQPPVCPTETAQIARMVAKVFKSEAEKFEPNHSIRL